VIKRALLLAAVAALALVPFSAVGALAQTTNGESRAAILLTLPSSTRGLALGEAWGAIADDESAIFYNPAQLARVRGASVGGSIQRYIAQTTLGAAAFAIPLRRGAVAFGLQMLDYGSADEYTIADGTGGQLGSATGGSVTAQDIVLTGGYGISLGERRAFRLGAAAKYVRQTVANYSGSSAAVDLGLAYTFVRGWDVAAAVQHLGADLRLAAVSAPLPWTWRASVAAPAMVTPTFSLRPIAEVRQSSGGTTAGALAAEGVWHPSVGGPVLAARAGFTFMGNGEDRSPLALGGGVTLGRITVDYAYESFDALGGATHRVGIRFAAGSRIDGR
jgi:hypothetical protein